MTKGRVWVGIAVAATMGSASAKAFSEEVVRREHREHEVVVEGRVAGEREGEERYPTSYPERPITMGAFILAPSLAIEGGQIALGDTKGEGFAGMYLGARFGITNDLEVHAYPVPILFTPDGGYGGLGPFLEGLGGPSFGADYRFVKGAIELGAGLDVTIFTNLITGVQIAPSIPARVHLGKLAALDVAVALPINAGLKVAVVPGAAVASTTTVGLEIPVAFSFDLVEPIVHVGAGTGFGIDDFSNAGKTAFIPFGIFGGYAVRGRNGPLLDIDPFIKWPYLFTPGIDVPGTNKVNFGNIVAGLEVGGFIYL